MEVMMGASWTRYFAQTHVKFPLSPYKPVTSHHNKGFWVHAIGRGGDRSSRRLYCRFASKEISMLKKGWCCSRYNKWWERGITWEQQLVFSSNMVEEPWTQIKSTDLFASINYLGYSINILYEDAVYLPSYATNVNLWGWSVQLRFPRPIGHPRLEKAQNNAQEAEKCRENKRKYCHKHGIPLWSISMYPLTNTTTWPRICYEMV